MALNPREAFKAGFLLRCAEGGLSPEPVIKCAFDALELAKPLGAFGGNALALSLLGLPVAAGAGAGYLAHKATEKPIDADDVKEMEVADEYRRLARVARVNAKLRHLRSRATHL